jgi:hypothetical protein
MLNEETDRLPYISYPVILCLVISSPGHFDLILSLSREDEMTRDEMTGNKITRGQNDQGTK